MTHNCTFERTARQRRWLVPSGLFAARQPLDVEVRQGTGGSGAPKPILRQAEAFAMMGTCLQRLGNVAAVAFAGYLLAGTGAKGKEVGNE